MILAQNEYESRLRYKTTLLEAYRDDGRMSTGTGFFFAFSAGDTPTAGTIPAIVTNKHVVADCHSCRFRVHLGRPDEGGELAPTGDFTGIILTASAFNFVPHPNPEIDLCAMFFQPLAEHLATQGKQVLAHWFTESDIASQGYLDRMRVVEDVMMIGYPNGLWDSVNNFPLFRRGFTSSHPAVDYDGKPVTVIDAACFPGSSGSPVLQYSIDPLTRREPKLLGVLFAGPVITAEGEIVVVEVPTVKEAVPVTAYMMHLGHIVKARELLGLRDALRLEAQRSPIG